MRAVEVWLVWGLDFPRLACELTSGKWRVTPIIPAPVRLPEAKGIAPVPRSIR
jgi:hypothetical protein